MISYIEKIYDGPFVQVGYFWDVILVEVDVYIGPSICYNQITIKQTNKHIIKGGPIMNEEFKYIFKRRLVIATTEAFNECYAVMIDYPITETEKGRIMRELLDTQQTLCDAIEDILYEKEEQDDDEIDYGYME